VVRFVTSRITSNPPPAISSTRRFGASVLIVATSAPFGFAHQAVGAQYRGTVHIIACVVIRRAVPHEHVMHQVEEALSSRNVTKVPPRVAWQRRRSAASFLRYLPEHRRYQSCERCHYTGPRASREAKPHRGRYREHGQRDDPLIDPHCSRMADHGDQSPAEARRIPLLTTEHL
jgi:hypothetical protein